MKPRSKTLMIAPGDIVRRPTDRAQGVVQARQGDTIRAYDFKPMTGREDCYIEGRVVDVNNTEQGYQSYKIEVT